MHNSSQTDLKSFIQNELIKNIKKVRGKHAPISEIVNSVPKTLIVEKIYDLRENYKNFFLFIVKNYSKVPKLRYFLALSLAYTSSDLLVQLAMEFAVKNDLKLIQYSIFPKTLRIQLLLLKEIVDIKDYANSIEKLKSYRKEFRHKLGQVKNLVENE
jgi:hypothetical protein